MSARRSSIRVAIFVVGALALLVATVLQLGRAQSLFARKVVLTASFDDVSGLVVGAPVRLAGLDIGIVERVDFGSDLRERKVHLRLGVESRFLPRIRRDSVARLASKGLLGDTIINISVGGADSAPIEPGAELTTAESGGAAELLGDVGAAVGSLRSVGDRLGARADALFDEELVRDVHRIARATAAVVEQAEQGRGLAHALLRDPRLADEALRVLRGGRAVVEDAGPAVADLRRAAAGIAQLSSDLRTQRGLLHALVYDEQQAALVSNLTAASSSLRRVGEDLEHGKGTVGALLRDPSVYEDLKLILGKVERNKLVKALVRYTIKSDGLTP